MVSIEKKKLKGSEGGSLSHMRPKLCIRESLVSILILSVTSD